MYTLTFLLNLGRLDRICYVDQFIMAYGGLRGGIAFSLCQLTCLQNVPAIKNMLCATIIAVFFTSFVQVRAHRTFWCRLETRKLIKWAMLKGMSIKPIVEWLKVKRQDNTKKTLGQEFVISYLDHMLTGIEDIVGNRGRHWWVTWSSGLQVMCIRLYIKVDAETIQMERRISESNSSERPIYNTGCS